VGECTVNIVLVAQESAGVQALQLVQKTQHRLVAVLTGTKLGEGAERGVTVAAVAKDLGIPVFPARVVRDRMFSAELRRERVDVLLNVHSLYLIDAEVLAAPRIGSFNLHPGPLPEYAGLNVPSWAIYRGETSHGVTLHWMVPKVDAGPVAFSASFPLTPVDTGVSVFAKCVQHGMPLISKLLTVLAHDPSEIPAIEQDLTRRRYFGGEVPHGGWVPWSLAARQVVDFVRACDYGPWPSPWGLPRTAISGTEIAVHRASLTGEEAVVPPGTVGALDGDGIRVAAADEWVVIRRLRIDGKSVAPAAVLRAGDALVGGG
jgi:UDP-4-amino-4-deoxy-L-arabinose formyltransferase/UDP-glucuronic acid dehydrogenase (UDP-4-keto-hexauronic acid decarboxylating)